MLYVKTLKSVPYLDPDWLEESAEVKVVCINDGYQHRVSKLALAAFSPTFLEALLGTGIATSHLLCGPGAGEGGGGEDIFGLSSMAFLEKLRAVSAN